MIQSGYDIDSLDVSFRSNEGCSATGYFLWAFCTNVSSVSFSFEETQKRQVTSEVSHENFTCNFLLIIIKFIIHRVSLLSHSKVV